MLVKHTEKPSRDFTQIPHRIITGLGELSIGAKLMYIFLLDQSPSFNPTISGLGRQIYNRGKSVGAEAVRRWTKELKEIGLLEIRQIGFNKYQWHLFDSCRRNKEVE